MSKRFGELHTAFMVDDHKKILQLTDDLPSAARSTIQAISDLLNERRSQGMTPFIAAILFGNVPLCARLLKEGVRTEFLNKGSCTNVDSKNLVKLHQEVGTQLLLGPKANVFKDFNKTSPIFWAMKSGNLFLVEKFVEAGHDLDLPAENVQGMPALSIAVMDNKVDLVKKLLSLSANVHAKDFNSLTPLDAAIDTFSLDSIRLLMQHGENPNCKNHRTSPINRAIFNSSNTIAIIELLFKFKANINFGILNYQLAPPLICAVSCRRFDLVTYLIHKGADVRVQDEKGETALHVLTMNINENVKDIIASAQLLIEKGANVNVKNLKGETPIFGACRRHIPELVELLISAGADVNIRSNHETSPLNVALTPCVVVTIDTNNAKQLVTCKPEDKSVLNKQCEITKMLLKSGADVHSKEASKVTPIHAAVTNSNIEAIKILLEAGANINCQDNLGIPPLFCAIEKNDLVTAKYLVQKGASVNIKDFQGISAMKIALQRNFPNMVTYLVKAGALDINESNSKGLTPLHFAALTGNYKVAKMLIEEGVNLKPEDTQGNTPFDFLILQPGFRGEFMTLFLDYGLDPNHADKNGLTPYQYIALKQIPELLKIVWYYRSPCDEIDLERLSAVYSRKKQYLPTLNSFIAAGVNFEKQVTSQNELYKTQKEFLLGVKNNDKQLVLDSLKKGAVARGCNKELQNPLHYLVERRFHDVLEILLKHSVPTNVLDSNGLTPLQLAVRGGDLQSCRLLLQYGALYKQMLGDHSQQHQNDEMRKLFHTIDKVFRFVQKGNSEALKMIKKSVDDLDWELYQILMNCVNGKGQTVISAALDYGQTDIIRKLIALKLAAPDLC